MLLINIIILIIIYLLMNKINYKIKLFCKNIKIFSNNLQNNFLHNIFVRGGRWPGIDNIVPCEY